jgi:hypothetical protein
MSMTDKMAIIVPFASIEIASLGICLREIGFSPGAAVL